MKTSRLDAHKAIKEIQNLVKDLLNLFLFCKSRKEEVAKLKESMDELDKSNPEYNEILLDNRENIRMNFRLIILILSFFIDFFLLYEALIILCDQFGWSEVWKFLIPAILIILEVAVSYFSILYSRDADKPSRISRKLQYFILPVLVGFSILAVYFHFQGYNPDIDGSLFGFLTFRITIQLIMLVSSIMLHLWLILNAEDMAEALAYLRYRNARKKINSIIINIEESNTARYYPEFTRLTHRFVRDKNIFVTSYPEMQFDFAASMPQELIDGINTVMGRVVIGNTSPNPG